MPVGAVHIREELAGPAPVVAVVRPAAVVVESDGEFEEFVGFEGAGEVGD